MEIKTKSESQAAGRGGPRPGAGRPVGSPNKSTLEQKARISDLARLYADDALAALAKIARNGKSESARVAAACALLDRAFGKPPVALPEIEPAEDSVALLIKRIQDNGRMGRMPLRKDIDPESEC